jgi:hypothetical protein
MDEFNLSDTNHDRLLQVRAAPPLDSSARQFLPLPLQPHPTAIANPPSRHFICHSTQPPLAKNRSDAAARFNAASALHPQPAAGTASRARAARRSAAASAGGARPRPAHRAPREHTTARTDYPLAWRRRRQWSEWLAMLDHEDPQTPAWVDGRRPGALPPADEDVLLEVGWRGASAPRPARPR